MAESSAEIGSAQVQTDTTPGKIVRFFKGVFEKLGGRPEDAAMFAPPGWLGDPAERVTATRETINQTAGKTPTSAPVTTKDPIPK